MLIKLLRTFLRRYRSLLVAVVLLQAAQTGAALLLATLNADIIDKGVAQGDTGYIWRHGAVMLVVSLVQICFSIAAWIRFSSATACSGVPRASARRESISCIGGVPGEWHPPRRTCP